MSDQTTKFGIMVHFCLQVAAALRLYSCAKFGGNPSTRGFGTNR